VPKSLRTKAPAKGYVHPISPKYKHSQYDWYDESSLGSGEKPYHWKNEKKISSQKQRNIYQEDLAWRRPAHLYAWGVLAITDYWRVQTEGVALLSSPPCHQFWFWAHECGW
jgi:hypothetical protein